MEYLFYTGFRLKSQNHSESINFYLHPLIAKVFDIILTIFLFSLAIIMTAGGASTINEALAYLLAKFFNLSSANITHVVLQFDRLIAVLGGVTPFLVAVVVMIAVYYFVTGHIDFTAANQYSNNNKSISPGWWFDAINYASLQIAAAFSFLTVMGGKLKFQKSTVYGGLIGGLIITFLLLMINLGLITEFDKIKHVALPSLLLAKQISPSIGTIMSVIMVLVIYNTVVGLMYAFATRFSQPFTKRYFSLIIVMAIITHLYIYWIYLTDW